MEIINLRDQPVDVRVYKISDLKSAVRDENRVNIFVDGVFEFSLDVAQVVEYKLKVGRELTAEELAGLKAESEFGKLYQRALEWALLRPRSESETREYLKRAQAKRQAENRMRARNAEKSSAEKREYRLKTKALPEISSKQIERVMARLLERGYVDDEKFARYYVENRFVKKGVSRRRLVMELGAKGISAETIDAVLSSGERDEAEEIRKIIARKAGRYDAEHLIQYLIRQGFDYQLSQSLVREMDLQSSE